MDAERKQLEDDLIWITEAMVKYKHSRNWFNARIKRGDFEVVPLPGRSKIYLKRKKVEQYLRKHPEGAPDGR